MRYLKSVNISVIVLFLLSATVSPWVPIQRVEAQPIPRGPIHIINDPAFNETNGVTSGNGTEDDPFIIEDFNITNTGYGIIIERTNAYFVLRDLLVVASGAGGTGIKIDKCTNFTVENVTVRKYDTNIWIVGSSRGMIRNSSVDGGHMVVDSGRDVDIIGCHAVNGRLWVKSSRNIKVEDMLIEGIERTLASGGITVSSSSYVSIDGCTIRDNNSYGITTGDSTAVSINDTTVRGTHFAGIRSSSLDVPGDCIISGCDISDVGDYGIFALYNVTMSIVGNTITNCSQGTIYIEDCSLNRFTDNDLDSVLQFRPTRPEQAANMTVSGNAIAGHPVRFYEDENAASISHGDGQTILLRCIASIVSDHHRSPGSPSTITLLFSQRTRLTNLTLGGSDEGVASACCEGTSFSDVVIEDTRRAFVLFHDVDSSITGCEVVNSTDAVSMAATSGLEITGSRFLNCDRGLTGPRVVYYPYSYGMGTADHVTDCTFQGVNVGLNVNQAEPISVMGNSFSDGARFLIAEGLDGGTVSGNRVSNCSASGFHFRQPCDNLTINHNVIRDCPGTGMTFGNGEYHAYLIEGNLITNCTTGIQGAYHHGFSYMSNTISDCDIGLDVGASALNMTNNRIAGCNAEALKVNGNGWIHHNNFVDNNGDQVAIGNSQVSVTYQDNGGFHFDDGAEGNYWSDYITRYPGASRDGSVWTTPYVIDAPEWYEVVDRYPLVGPIDMNPPVALAPPDVTIQEGDTLTLDGTGSTDDAGIVVYEWTIPYSGDIVTLKGSIIEFDFLIPGTYLISLNVSDVRGDWDVDTLTVTVRDITPPTPVLVSNVTVDQNEEVRLDASMSYDNVEILDWNWTWEVTGETHRSTGPTMVTTFDEIGVHEITLDLTDGDGNTASAYINVTVRDGISPVAVTGPDVDIGQGTTVTLDGSASTDNVGVVAWTWTFTYDGEDTTLEGETALFTFDFPGEYQVTLTVEDAAGHEGEAILSIRVRDNEAPTLAKLKDIETGTGDSVTFDGRDATDNVGVVNWTWTFKEGGKTMVLEGMTVEHTFDEPGDYEVTLTVTDADGNEATDTFTVTVSSGAWVWAVVALVVVMVALGAFVWWRRSRG
jgi:PKD repeat protein